MFQIGGLNGGMNQTPDEFRHPRLRIAGSGPAVELVAAIHLRCLKANNYIMLDTLLQQVAVPLLCTTSCSG